MNKLHWQQAQELFGIAAGLNDEDRRAFIERLGEQNPALQSEVASLVSANELREILPHSAAPDVVFDAEHSPADDSALNKTANGGNQIVGELIGERYLITKKLGGGGMGDVFLAHDRNLVNREVVVKLLRSEVLKNKEALRKFRQEVEALARLRDENIVTIFDFGTHASTPFLVMEYVAGEDLSKIISPILFSTRDIKQPEKFARQILEPETAAARHLRDKLGTNALQNLANAKPHEIAHALRDAFDKLLGDSTLYDERAFESIRLSAETEEQLERSRRDGRTLKFNRLLLEDAFPEHILSGWRKRLSAADAATVFRQLGIALAHGHENGIIHRDLKPANIMICTTAARGLTVKLIDFGVAKVRESLVAPTTELGGWFGTQDYMSPEQLRGERDLTEASDIYALGLIAYEAVVGERAMPGKTPIEQYKLQEAEQLENIAARRPDLPASVETVIRRALRFKPEERFASAAEFGEALAAAFNETKQEPTPKTNFETKMELEFETKLTTAAPEIVAPQTATPEIALPLMPPRTPAMSIPILPDAPPETEPAEMAKQAAPKQTRSHLPKILGASAVAALLLFAVVGGWWFFNRGEANVNQAPVEETVKRELNYKLIVQKFYAGKPFQEPFEATGDEIFGDGWRFKMWLKSPQNGFLYLLNAGQTGDLAMLFPHPDKNGGAAVVRANQAIETTQIEFDKKQGTEKFWIVWAAEPIAELEAVKKYVNPKELGKIAAPDEKEKINALLQKHVAQTKAVAQIDSADAGRLKKLAGSGDVLVKLAEFRHN